MSSPSYPNEKFGEVPWLEATATIDEEHGEIAFFAVNRSQTDALAVDVDLRSLPGYRVVEQIALDHDDPSAVNSAANPDNVQPRRVTGARVDEGRLSAVLPPLSWNVIRLATR